MGLTATSNRSHSLSRSSTTGLTLSTPKVSVVPMVSMMVGTTCFRAKQAVRVRSEIRQIDVVVLPTWMRMVLFSISTPSRGEVGDVGVVTALGVDDAVVLIVAEPLVLGPGQALANAEQVAVEVTEGPPG